MGTTQTPNYDLIKPNIYEELDAWGGHLNGNSDKIDTQMKTNETAAATADTKGQTGIDNAATADAKAVAAQSTADTALANAATADGKAVAAQSSADAAQTTANTADGKADANAANFANYAPLASPALTGSPTKNGVNIPNETEALNLNHRAGITVVDTFHNISATDIGKSIFMNVTSANRNFTLLSDTDAPAIALGFRANVAHWGDNAYDVVITPGTGVTIISKENKLKLTTFGAGATIEKVAANTWWVVGDLEA